MTPMNAQTLEALKASIAKWERNAEAKTWGDVFLGITDCPLCQLFHSYCGGPNCEGCPINDAGYYRCGGTPYEFADEAYGEWIDGEEKASEDFHAAARDEVAFLKSLLPVQP